MTDETLRPAIARAMAGESISSLARRSGVDRAALSNYLGGKAHLRSDIIERLLLALALRVVPGGRAGED